MAHTITRGGKMKARAAMKLVRLAVFAMLFTAASAGRAAPVTPVRSTIKNSEMISRSENIIGCTPKILARDMVLFCREPRNGPFRVEACCGAAVGTVARPSCFCLVKKEAAFGMSPLFNVTNLKSMLARCGASVYLTQMLHNPCDGSYKETQTAECPPPIPSNHFSFKVLSFIEMGIIAMLMATIGFVVFYRPAVAPGNDKDDDAPLHPMDGFNDGGAGNKGEGLPDERIGTQVRFVNSTHEDDKDDDALLDAMAYFNNDGAGNDDEALHDGSTEIGDDVASKNSLIDEKRVPIPNTKFIGGPWQNDKPRGRGDCKKVKGGTSKRGSNSNKRPQNHLVAAEKTNHVGKL